MTAVGSSRSISRRPLAILAVLPLIASGCQQVPSQPGPSANESVEVEPNGSFGQAKTIEFAADDSVVLAGRIDPFGDVDVFDVGPMNAGDRVRLEARRPSGSLRVALAVFDDDGELVNEDTLTGAASADAIPTIEHVVREDSARLFAAISPNFVGSSTGPYEIVASVARDGLPPAPAQQIVVLGFDGGEVTDPFFGTIDVASFEAARIHPIYESQSDEIKASIRRTILQNYERFDVAFIDSDDEDELVDGAYSRVLFGGYSAVAFGAAEDVDLYNGNPQDGAVVFTESFDPRLFGMVPNAEQIGVAIGNVASHELGHLLGLHHVNDPRELMDEASPASTLLEDAEFSAAPLSPSVFPLGTQDAADLLYVTVGPNPGNSLGRPTSRLFSPRQVGSNGTWPSPLRHSSAEVRLPAGAALIPPTGSGPVKCLNCLMRSTQVGRRPRS